MSIAQAQNRRLFPAFFIALAIVCRHEPEIRKFIPLAYLEIAARSKTQAPIHVCIGLVPNLFKAFAASDPSQL